MRRESGSEYCNETTMPAGDTGERCAPQVDVCHRIRGDGCDEANTESAVMSINKWMFTDAALEEEDGWCNSAAGLCTVVDALREGDADMLRRNLHSRELQL